MENIESKSPRGLVNWAYKKAPCIGLRSLWCDCFEESKDRNTKQKYSFGEQNIWSDWRQTLRQSNLNSPSYEELSGATKALRTYAITDYWLLQILLNLEYWNPYEADGSW